MNELKTCKNCEYWIKSVDVLNYGYCDLAEQHHFESNFTCPHWQKRNINWRNNLKNNL
jgi:hypothetical protein